jgi:YaiO family outer membrane protein
MPPLTFLYSLANSLQGMAFVNRKRQIGRALLFGLALTGVGTDLHAQVGTVTVELNGQVQSLSGAYPDGAATGLRASWRRERDFWTGFVGHERRFGASGEQAGVANTHTFSERWYTYAAAAASTETFFLPRYRVDGMLARKLGSENEWVVSASGFAAAAHDEHRDRSVGLGVIRYFGSGLIVDAGILWNRSSPGSVTARRQTLTATYAQPRYSLSSRVGWGRESYQLIGASAELVDFASTEASVRYQRWLSSRAGATLIVEYYDNPFYRRGGLSLSVFRVYGP